MRLDLNHNVHNHEHGSQSPSHTLSHMSQHRSHPSRSHVWHPHSHDRKHKSEQSWAVSTQAQLSSAPPQASYSNVVRALRQLCTHDACKTQGQHHGQVTHRQPSRQLPAEPPHVAGTVQHANHVSSNPLCLRPLRPHDRHDAQTPRASRFGALSVFL